MEGFRKGIVNLRSGISLKLLALALVMAPTGEKGHLAKAIHSFVETH